jgi:hypothetical protein
MVDPNSTSKCSDSEAMNTQGGREGEMSDDFHGANGPFMDWCYIDTPPTPAELKAEQDLYCICGTAIPLERLGDWLFCSRECEDAFDRECGLTDDEPADCFCDTEVGFICDYCAGRDDE